MPDRGLDAELRDIGRRLDVPPAPDPARMVSLVRGRLVANGTVPADGTVPAHGAVPARRAVPVRRWLRYAAAIVVIAFAVAVAGSTQVRAALVEFFRFGGVIVEQGSPSTPASTPSSTPGVVAVDDLAAARAMVAFPVRVPAELGPPDEVSVTDGRVVSLAYHAAGIRLDQLDGTLDLAFAKNIPDQSDVEWIQVDNGTALWLRRPHDIVYVDRTGQRHTATARPAADTLVWQHGRVTLRLEGAGTLERAVVIMQSMR